MQGLFAVEEPVASTSWKVEQLTVGDALAKSSMVKSGAGVEVGECGVGVRVRCVFSEVSVVWGADGAYFMGEDRVLLSSLNYILS